MATLAPSFARPNATALPIPRLPPVTIAALPLSSRSMRATRSFLPPLILRRDRAGCQQRARPNCGSVAPPARGDAQGSSRSNHLIAQAGFALPHVLEVLQQDVDHTILVTLRLPRRMRRDEDVGHGPER